MAAVIIGGALAFVMPLLAIQGMSVSIGRALRTYSRSRLEDICKVRGYPGRFDSIIHLDEQTERAVEAIAVVAEICIAALVARLFWPGSPPAAILTGLGLGIGVHFVASVIGRVWAETLLTILWPITPLLRAIGLPMTATALAAEKLTYLLTGPESVSPRPASVEVELINDSDHSETTEVDVSNTTRDLLEHVVALTRLDVSEIMTPRSQIVALPSNVSAKVAAGTFRETGLSRIPIYGANRDDIVGVLYGKDLFASMTTDDSGEAVSPSKLVRPAYFVPESKNANDLLGSLRERRSQIAIVLDEYGGVAGLITLEDLFEALVGEIDDEHDLPSPKELIQPLGGTRYEVDASAPISQVNLRLRLHLPTDEEYQTLGGFVFNRLGSVPASGEMFEADGVQFTVLEVADRSIRRVLVDLS